MIYTRMTTFRYLLATALCAAFAGAAHAVTYTAGGSPIGGAESYEAQEQYAPAASSCPYCGSSDIDTSADPYTCNDCGYQFGSAIGAETPLEGGEWLLAGCAALAALYGLRPGQRKNA